MKKLFTMCCLLQVLIAAGNDGVFYSSGNTLVPLKETTIRLKKEILNLTRKNDWMQVDIYFEFYNPGPEKELTVGFVTPPAFGDIAEEEEQHPFIKDFSVLAADKILSYKIARMKETGFKTDSRIAQGFDFVYYFQVRFAKGITVIRHSYLYRGGSSVEAKHDFDYRLTTGTAWANSGIDDFELNIDMGDDSYFSVPASFGTTTASWLVAGIGRMSKTNFSLPYDPESNRKLRMIYLRKGKLQLRTANFKPSLDLTIQVWQLHNDVHFWNEASQKNDFSAIMDYLWGDDVPELLAKLSDEELRLYRNLNYARMGFEFKDETLKKTFSKYIWYLPDPALKAESIPEYFVTKELLQLITAEEKKRKQQ